MVGVGEEEEVYVGCHLEREKKEKKNEFDGGERK